jgi:hypothetical protein
MFMIFHFTSKMNVVVVYMESLKEKTNTTKMHKKSKNKTSKAVLRDNLSFLLCIKLRSIFHDPRQAAGNLLEVAKNSSSAPFKLHFLFSTSKTSKSFIEVYI